MATSVALVVMFLVESLLVEGLPQLVLFPDEVQQPVRPDAAQATVVQQQSALPRGGCSGAELVTDRSALGLATAEGCSLTEGYVLWPGDSHATQCAELLSTEPCAQGFWVTLFNDIDGTSTCSQRHCTSDQVEMHGRCHQLNDTSVCPSTMILYTNEFGTGECDCPEGTIYYLQTNICYTPYTQGPCQNGFIIKV
ncbi:unnamed protein product, partial [Meganyctiphanes norvegica]